MDTTRAGLDTFNADRFATTDPQDLVAMGYAIEEGHSRLVNEVRAAIKFVFLPPIILFLLTTTYEGRERTKRLGRHSAMPWRMDMLT
jgi:hypothetical protein